MAKTQNQLMTDQITLLEKRLSKLEELKSHEQRYIENLDERINVTIIKPIESLYQSVYACTLFSNVGGIEVKAVLLKIKSTLDSMCTNLNLSSRVNFSEGESAVQSPQMIHVTSDIGSVKSKLQTQAKELTIQAKYLEEIVSQLSSQEANDIYIFQKKASELANDIKRLKQCISSDIGYSSLLADATKIYREAQTRAIAMAKSIPY